MMPHVPACRQAGEKDSPNPPHDPISSLIYFVYMEHMPERKFGKEQEFHDQRWAKQEAERGLRDRLVGKTKDDFMREEALRDDADFEKKFIRESKKEYETWEAHCKPVRQAFLEQVRDPEGVDFVTVAAFLPGGMRAAGIAGSALALDFLGANSGTVDYAVGSSSGDTVATRFVGGREELLRGIGMFTGPLADKKFIDIRRPGNAININYMKALEDNGEYALDQGAIQKAHCKLWTVVTEPMKGNTEPQVRILDKKAIKPSISTGSVATMSIPGFTGDIPEIDGTKYHDGGFGVFPIKEIVEKVKAENPDKKVKVLIFTQASFDAMADIKPSSTTELAAKLMGSAARPMEVLGSGKAGSTFQHLAKALVLKENLRKSLEAIEKETGADIGVIWAPPSSLDTMSIDADELQMAVSQSFRGTVELFGGEQPDEIPNYTPKKKRLA